MTQRRALAIGCPSARALALLARARASAGSEIVAALGSGRTPQDLLDALDGKEAADPILAAHVAEHPGSVPPVPALALPALGLVRAGIARRSPYSALAGLLPRGRGDATFLREYGDALAGHDCWTPHPATWIVAADVATGERVAFGAPGAPPAGLWRGDRRVMGPNFMDLSRRDATLAAARTHVPDRVAAALEGAHA